MRVLHLIDPGVPGGGACTLRMLAEPAERIPSVHQDVLILGTRAHYDLARRSGVDPVGVLSTPMNLPIAAKGPLQSFIRAYEFAHGHYDLIHCWTERAALLATRAAPTRTRLATLSIGPISSVQTHWLMRELQRSPMPLLATSRAVADEYFTMGIDEGLISVLPPGINPESPDWGDRDDLRERWEVDDDTFVIGLLAEPTSWADARTGVQVAARVAASGRRVRLVMHQKATRRVDAERWARHLGSPQLIIIEDDVAEPWKMINGLDAALLVGGQLNSVDLSEAGSPAAILTGGGRQVRPMPGTMPLLWAMAAGVPVIAEAGDAVQGIVEDGRSGLLVGQGDINGACDRIVRIYDDPTIAGRIGSAAQRFVSEHYHVSAFCVRLKDAWQRAISGRTVRVIGDYEDPLIEKREEEAIKAA